MMAQAPNAAAISFMWALVAIEIALVTGSASLFAASLILWLKGFK